MNRTNHLITQSSRLLSLQHTHRLSSPLLAASTTRASAPALSRSNPSIQGLIQSKQFSQSTFLLGEDKAKDADPKTPTPSNKAHPTITDGRQSPNVDEKGEPKDDVPEDVKQHNREMQERHDRAYNQIADQGTRTTGWGKDK